MQGMTEDEIKTALTAPLFVRKCEPTVGQVVTYIIDGVLHTVKCHSFVVQDAFEGPNFMDLRRAELAARKATTTPTT